MTKNASGFDDNVSVDEDEHYKNTDEMPNEQDDEDGTEGKRKRKRKRKKRTTETDTSTSADVETKDTDQSAKDLVEHTIYVEGIPFDATPDQVKEFFSQGGIDDVVELRLPTWQDSGRLRGYGHVLFESSASYEKALKLSGQHLGKRYLTIQAANIPRNNELSILQPTENSPPLDCRTLFVNNLPYDATEEDIAEVFVSLGVVMTNDSVRIARNSVTRQSKGFCYIDFKSPKDAQKIMQSGRRFTVKGRPLRLDWDTGRIKGSYRSESGRLWTKEVKEKTTKVIHRNSR